MRCVGHAARIEKKQMHANSLEESTSDIYVNNEGNIKIILRNPGYEDRKPISAAHDRLQWQAFVNTVFRKREFLEHHSLS
jgi:hypothetical protein